MAVYVVDPLTDPRWPELLARHPRASVFHTTNWLVAMKRTYGYEPVVYTTSGPKEDMEDGIVCCRVSSRLTGKRLVSLPFSDHCDMLVQDAEKLRELLCALVDEVQREGLSYVELRPIGEGEDVLKDNADLGFGVSQLFSLYYIDTDQELDAIFSQFQKSSVIQRIRRSEREGVVYEEGSSDQKLREFYKLLLHTRRKHGLPPQPMAWFKNLRDSMGDALTVRVTYKDGVPTATKMSLCYKNAYVAKYQAADYAYSKLGGTQLLGWMQIQAAKEFGASVYDMGRCEADNESLAASKVWWGAQCKPITYLRYPCGAQEASHDGAKTAILKKICTRLPDRLLALTGDILYKHVG